MDPLLAEAKAALVRLNIFPKKKWGQNFMIDSAALEAIATAVVSEGTQKPAVSGASAIIEIGPGLGFLTRFLLKKGMPVIAVEKDRRMAAFLGQNLNNVGLTVIEGDLLTFDIEKDLKILSRAVVAGNIPYNITTPILEWLIEHRHKVSRAVLTVQKEVAERITAVCGSKAWGALSVFIQFYTEPRILRAVPRQCFFPPPKVDSSVIRLDFFPEGRLKVKSQENFFSLVRKAFQKRRKTVLNALTDETRERLSKKSIAGSLEKAGIDPIRRPETLSIAEWAALSETL